jgi:hypothetical protein
MGKGRALFAVGALIAVLAVVLGFSSAPASGGSLSKKQIVVIGTSPAQPVGGQTYTMSFELLRAGVPRHMAGVNCYALAAGRTATVVDQGTDGTIGHCTWAIPRRASGGTLDGVVSAQGGNGVWIKLGFDVPIA